MSGRFCLTGRSFGYDTGRKFCGRGGSSGTELQRMVIGRQRRGVPQGELHEVAKEFDAETPLGEDEFLVVTDDGSIGLLFPNLKEPEMYFVSPEWAVVNILKEDPRKYIVPGDGAAAGAQTAGNVANSAQQSAATAAKVFCENCGAELRPGSRFCEHCGAKNAPEFCANCGTKLEGGSQFCGNCGVRV